MSDPSALFTGKVFNGCWVIEHLIDDKGNFSNVFCARHAVTGAQVAVKVLKFGRLGQIEPLEEFEAERVLFEKLRSCFQVLTLEDSGEVEVEVVPGSRTRFPFLVLELGEASLATLLMRARDRVLWPDRVRIVREVTLGIMQMHRLGVVHRDLKSENVILVGASRPTAKLGDLGRAKDLTTPPRHPSVLYAFTRGDPRFAPPELAWGLGEGDAAAQMRSDLYQIGALLFEVATGLGLTSLIVPQTIRVTRAMQAVPPDARIAAYNAQIPDLRDAYEAGYRLFADSAPACIRGSGTTLLRLLTDPDPARREPRRLPGGRKRERGDLQWLLRRLDTLSRELRESQVRTKYRSRRVAA